MASSARFPERCHLGQRLVLAGDGAAFLIVGVDGVTAGFAAIALLGLLVTVGAQIAVAAWRDDPRVGVGVGVYLVVILAMTALGIGTRDGWAILGVLAFTGSDAILGWNRFVARTEAPLRRVTVHVTYHVAQASLVLWIAA